MKKPGRKRSSTNMPSHINIDKLPDRVWFNASGAGKWMFSYYDGFGSRKNKRICGPKATLAEIWQAAEAQQVKTLDTFASLALEFERTRIWHKLSASTKKDYTNCRQMIITRDASTGKLGDVPLSKWTVGLIRRYRDKRAEDSESRANKELAYIKRLFAWAYEYEKVPMNPATGIKKISIAPRQHYAEDKDYLYMLNIAKQSGYWYVPHAMELAYLCRLRMCEVLELTDANERDNGLLVYRHKGSKANITEWQPRLRAVWEELKKTRDAILSARKQPHPIKSDRRFLFISERTGDPITDSGMQTAIQRIKAVAKEQAEKDGVEFTTFTFHDQKRKGISDTPLAERQASAGHRSEGMMRVYDVLPDLVKPTKE